MAQAASDAPSPPSSFSTSRMPGQTSLSHPARPHTTHTRQDRRCLDRSWRCVDSTAMEAQYGECCNVDVLKEMRMWSPYWVGREEQRLREEGGAPNGIRIRAAGLKGRCPRPLDDGGTLARSGQYTCCANGAASRREAAPFAARLAPACASSSGLLPPSCRPVERPVRRDAPRGRQRVSQVAGRAEHQAPHVLPLARSHRRSPALRLAAEIPLGPGLAHQSCPLCVVLGLFSPQSHQI